MEYRVITEEKLATTTADLLVVGLFEGTRNSMQPAALPEKTRKQIAARIDAGDFNGKDGESITVYEPQGISARRLMLLGLGKAGDWHAKSYRKSVRKLAGLLTGNSCKSVLTTLPGGVAERDERWQGTQLALAVEESLYRYSATLSKKKERPTLRRLVAVRGDSATARAFSGGLGAGKALGAGVNTARELGDLPANICTPSHLARQARSLARGNAAMKVSVLEEKQMRELGMGSLLSVSAGSEQPAKLIVIEYRGGPKSEQPVALVGKGVTFDSGGISIKPGAGMDEMKFDMCGAASVFGALTALAAMRAKVNVVGIVPATENLPSGRATKPGDVVTSMSGQTIEILNTDAEGRLILCDALTYAERYKPRAVIDIATLTGACIIALGHEHAGLMANDQALADALLEAGRLSGDTAWQLPLDDEYKQSLESNFADVANVGGRAAGTITAACFLSRFTTRYKWAHLDIAGVAWNQGKQKGGTGRPVSLLVQYVLASKGSK